MQGRRAAPSFGDVTNPFATALVRDGFAFAPAAPMRAALESHGLDGWDAFARSWNDLAVDAHMADGGRYRRRRHAALRVTPDAIVALPPAPHYQSRDHNRLNGGIERWFEPIRPDVVGSAAMRAVLRFCHDLFGGLSPDRAAWHVELHQFRIEAGPDAPGQPTPEGAHRDGVDWVIVLLVDRVNIASGVTSIADPAGASLGSFTLAKPFDAALVDDRRVLHGVTAVEPLDPGRPAHRDVLVATFRRD